MSLSPEVVPTCPHICSYLRNQLNRFLNWWCLWSLLPACQCSPECSRPNDPSQDSASLHFWTPGLDLELPPTGTPFYYVFCSLGHNSYSSSASFPSSPVSSLSFKEEHKITTHFLACFIPSYMSHVELGQHAVLPFSFFHHSFCFHIEN